MKTIYKIICSYCLFLTCSGCLFFGDSFASRDSLENATVEPCQVTVKFASQQLYSRPAEVYMQQAESFCGFQRRNRNEPMPTITNIMVQLTNASVCFSLSANEVAKLREASGGNLRLIIYSDGLGCVPPALHAYFASVNGNNPYSKEKHSQMLMYIKDQVVRWTKQVLNRG